MRKKSVDRKFNRKARGETKMRKSVRLMLGSSLHLDFFNEITGENLKTEGTLCIHHRRIKSNPFGRDRSYELGFLGSESDIEVAYRELSRLSNIGEFFLYLKKAPYGNSVITGLIKSKGMMQKKIFETSSEVVYQLSDDEVERFRDYDVYQMNGYKVHMFKNYSKVEIE
jgi:hypothetical protein